MGKKFDKKVRWEFEVSIHGYGKNIKEALKDAAERLESQIEREFSPSDFQAIEDHEVISVNPDDVDE
jgi:hypothetical protein